MKRISFLLFAVLISSMSLFTACGSDDDNDDTISSRVVAGTYNGTLVVKIGGNDVANEPKSLFLAENGDNAVDVVIKDFKLNVNIGSVPIPVNLGDLKVEKCILTQKDGKYAFSGVTELKGIQVPLTPEQNMPVDCEINIADAMVSGENLSLPIVVGVSLNGTKLMSVNVQYTGTKQ